MASTYLKTKLATNWENQSTSGVLARTIDRLFARFKSNPNYEAGPTEQDYGFWLDSNMKRDDFKGEIISESIFENAWKNQC